jgi:Flp pilus assembly protein TadG
MTLRKSLLRIARALRARNEGQAVVEFALVVPILLLLIASIIEFGRAWNIQQVLTDASRMGARTAVVADAALSNDSSVTAVIDEVMLTAGLDTALDTLTLGLRDSPGTPDTVTITYPFNFKFIGALLEWASSRSSITMSSQSVMRNE